MVGQTSMSLNLLNSSNLEQLALKELISYTYRSVQAKRHSDRNTVFVTSIFYKHQQSTQCNNLRTGRQLTGSNFRPTSDHTVESVSPYKE